MRDHPPADLVARAAAWQLVGAGDWRRAARHVRRLARDLPRFDSVWIDALVQARVLTPYQAAEIQAGRASSLTCGPYVIHAPAGDLGYAVLFDARHSESRQAVRLAIVRCEPAAAPQVAERLLAVVERCRGVSMTGVALPREAGVDAGRVWCCAAEPEGRTAGAWLAQHGRFPVEAAAEIGKQLLAALTRLEEMALPHGDVRACQVWLDRQGVIVLGWPGLRGAARPQEGYALADLPVDCYDGMPPERVRLGSPPTCEGDRYALGCLMWQLFTGRAPLAGADALARLKATQVHRMGDVRELAPDAEPAWAKALIALTEIDPSRRPARFPEVLSRVGEPSDTGRQALAAALRPRQPTWQVRRRRSQRPVASARALASAGICLLLVGVTALGWSRRPRTKLAQSAMAAPGATATLRPSAVPALQSVPDGETIVQAGDAARASTPGVRGGVRKQALDERAVRRASHSEPPLGDAMRPDENGVWHLPPVVQRPPRRWVVPEGGGIEGAPGRGSRVLVPPEGLTLVGNHFHVARVHFVCSGAAQRGAKPIEPLLRILGDQVEFRQCVWEGPEGWGEGAVARGGWPAAVAWQREEAGRSGELVQGETAWSDCVFRQVASALAAEREGALVAEFDNCLFVESGSVLRLSRTPAVDEPLYLGLTRATVRDVEAVIAMQLSAGVDVPGEITLQANDCVLAPAEAGTLLSLTGEVAADHLLRSLHWLGQGSVVMTRGPLAVQRRSSGKARPVDSGLLSIGGLVQSDVEFAGEARDSAAASQVVRWQVPLRSAEPPGIDGTRLLPTRDIGPGQSPRGRRTTLR